MRTCVLFVLILLGAAPAAFGQYTVSGKVMDARTKEPVAFASVVWGGGERWAATSEKGVFVLKNVPAGEATLTVTSLGYAKRKIKVTVDADVP
ncbi:MAG: carboxypeptidase-like regulatory domain-containing protein, partial [Prevotellaceae bacterium]|nr:carboxypeptidase-like regulatory domain-containing protein [Prevotellaceae bacterium]